MKMNKLLNDHLVQASLFLLSVFMIISCGSESDDGKLPYLGQMIMENGDTIYPKIPDFEFINQDSQIVNNETFEGKWYIADFFFTSCPTICPKVKQQMLRIYERFNADDRLLILSHSIDTKRDSVPVLKKYADKIGISSSKWHLVTGNKEEIYGIAPAYMSIVAEDPDAPGGYDHSGYIVLIDPDRHIRSYVDGTDELKVSAFMRMLDKVLANE
jgi:protein SCO1/2